MNERSRFPIRPVVEPSDYCDRRCERCAIRSECALFEDDRRARDALSIEELEETFTPLAMQLIDATIDRALAGEDSTPFASFHQPTVEGEAIETYAFRHAGTEYALAATEVCASVERGELAREALLVAY